MQHSNDLEVFRKSYLQRYIDHGGGNYFSSGSSGAAVFEKNTILMKGRELKFFTESSYCLLSSV